MVGDNHEAAGSYRRYSDWDNAVGAAYGGKTLGNDFLPLEEVGVVEWRGTGSFRI